MTRKRKIWKVLAVFTAINMLVNILAPSVSYALTSGPAQPEFSSFEPVATTNMVNEFTGDFTYNLPVIEIPGPHGSSYPMSLSYHSGAGSEEEASWVGYGWTLNAGAINRGRRGFPDDYRGNNVTYYNKTRSNWTITGGLGLSFEVFSFDADRIAGLSVSKSLRYNNYKGFGVNKNIGLNLGGGIVSVGYHVDDGQGSFSLAVNPAALLSTVKGKNKSARQQRAILKSQASKDKSSAETKKISYKLKNPIGKSSVNIFGSQYGLHSYSTATYPSNVGAYKGTSVDVSVGLMIAPTTIQLGADASFFGSFTIQKNLHDQEDIGTYGYLYSSEAISDEGKPSDDDLNDPDASYDGHGAMMDYIVEKETPYNKRNKFLGVPFNNADMFALSGEGLGGGFRFYNKGLGQFRPNSKISRTKSFSVGAELEVLINNGGGVDLGMGFHKLVETDWNEGISAFKNAEDQEEDEPVFLRFVNDLGGSWEYEDDDPIKADIIRDGGHYNATLNGHPSVMNNGQRAQRSSYIDYTRNEDMLTTGNGGKYYKAYSKREDLNSLVDRVNAGIADGIGEFAITKENGSSYIYGLPVYARNEERMTYGVQGASAGNVDNNYLVYEDNSIDGKTKVGQKMESPYATAHLLTEIRTPDYIDRSFDGPTIDDFGGYTRFNYHKAHGGTNGWYKWRIPYRGLSYVRNSLSEAMDDVGNVSDGEKEIYFLKSVETKTHVAIFSTSEREDGRDAPADAMSKNAAPGSSKLYKLDKIDLYTINDFEKEGDKLKRDEEGTPVLKGEAVPIKTVHFSYAGYDSSNPAAEELAHGVPNAENGRGKLTLKKVWFEYQGIHEARISPYIFNYTYSRETYPARYQYVQDEYPAAGLENPEYSKYAIDAWGSYRDEELGRQRFDNMQMWVDQNPDIAYDPAAWQLKTIVLPTGGEIQVQYESKDYSYVQDQEAHAMVSIASVERNAAGDKFYLNTEDLGITDSEKEVLAEMINARYGINSPKKKKMYFTFLYSMGDNMPDLQTCNAEYITGYTQLQGAGIDMNGIYVVLASEALGGYNTPQAVCKDFVMTQRVGKIDKGGNCDPSVAGINPDTDADPVDIAKGLVKQVANYKMAQFGNTLCKQFNPELSYFRVPMPKSKKGGGVRVKRLMMYEKGIDGASPVLYGSHYDYNFLDPLTGTYRSSGVATNEPGAIHDENILVDLLHRNADEQSPLDKIIAGRDKAQLEGPLGESVYPAASIGYGRVTVSGIHSGKTGTGFTVDEFYTARDYPVVTRHTDIHDEKIYKPLIFGLVNHFENKRYASQGYSFILNEMHGKVKSITSYSGEAIDESSAIPVKEQLQKATPVTAQQYEYYRPGRMEGSTYVEGDKVPVMSDETLGVEMRYPGKETDVTFAQKAVEDELYEPVIEIDGDVGYVPPFFFIPFGSVVPYMTHTESALYTHMTSKVVHYPAIVKKVTTYQDGVKHINEIVALDKYTGKAVVEKSYDDFAGTYLKQTIPAAWKYKNMRQISQNQKKKIACSYEEEDGAEYLAFTGSDCDNMDLLVRGDLVQLEEGVLYHVDAFDYLNSRVKIVPSALSVGSPAGDVSAARILRSGHTNQLAQKAGEITYHTTDNSDSPPSATDTERWVSQEDTAAPQSAFLHDLNEAVASIASTAGDEGALTLPGTYSNMDVSIYVSEFPQGCDGVNAESTTISNVEIYYYNREGKIDFQVLSFVIDCGGTEVTVESNRTL